MKTGKILKTFNLGNKKVVFRYPKFEDAEKLLKWINTFVDEKAYLATQEKIGMEKELDFLTSTLKQIELNKKVSVLVEFDGRIVGMTDIIKYSVDCKKHVGLLGIVFSKIARGTGVTEMAIKTLFYEAKKSLKIKTVQLTVTAQNKRAVAFYNKIGFEHVGTIKKGIYHYGKLLDESIMIKYL